MRRSIRRVRLKLKELQLKQLKKQVGTIMEHTVVSWSAWMYVYWG